MTQPKVDDPLRLRAKLALGFTLMGVGLLLMLLAYVLRRLG